MRNVKLSIVTTVSILLASQVFATGTGSFYEAKLGGDLSYHKVRLLEYSEAGAGTWLFRTNLPGVNGSFAYDNLVSYMQQRSIEANVSFPDVTSQKVKLVDISLLSVNSYGDLMMEKNFFEANPDKGLFYNWPIVGSLVSPNWLLEAERIKEVAALNVSIDNLPSLIPKIRNAVFSDVPSTIPTMIFFHCEAGSDRTGQVAGSYMMQYHGYTAKQAFEWDNEVATRTIVQMSQNGLLFYCWWLTYQQGYKNLDCMNYSSASHVEIPIIV